MVVYLPLSAESLQHWASTGVLGGRHQGFTVERDFLEAIGLESGEEADYNILSLASLDAAQVYGKRLVAVVEAEAESAGSLGRVWVEDPKFKNVLSLFVGEEDEVPDLAGLSLEEAWDSASCFFAENDMLWYEPGEWATLI
ncbi:MAG: hypothetical protein LBR21_07365 [Propionibacteriaceae bacterium]|jgi:hypothetical protein|nr:hypothetical protein [Propionibacteriaceae bacterium]